MNYSFVLPTLLATGWHFINSPMTFLAYWVVPAHRKQWNSLLPMNGNSAGVGASHQMCVFSNGVISLLG